MVELFYLAIGSPTEVAVPGFAQIRIRDSVERARRVKAGGGLVGNRLIMDESVCVRGADRLFIEPHRVELAAFYSCDFRANQGGAIFEILGAILRPNCELFKVSG